MQKRSIEDRVMEQEKKLAALMQKLQQEKDRLKQLKTKSENKARKYRNHMLIVCGAEIASLYDFSFLEEDEIREVVNFLRQIRDNGIFEIKRYKDEIKEKIESIEEITEKDVDESLFGNDFIF